VDHLLAGWLGKKGGDENLCRKAFRPQLILASVCLMMSDEKRGRERREMEMQLIRRSVSCVKGQ